MGTPLRVLMVEDSADDAALLTRELRRGGYDPQVARVDTAEDHTEAIRQPWDIVLVDFTMPRFSGSRALEMVRKHDLDLPFIFVSGTIGEDVAIAAMKAGAQDYIIKGNLKRLLPAIDRELREAVQRRERRRAEEDLRVIQNIALAVAAAPDVSAALATAVRMLCEVTGCQLGQSWVPDAEDSHLHCEDVWHSISSGMDRVHERSCSRPLARGEGPVGRAWQTHLPVWAGDLWQEHSDSAAHVALELGIDAFLAVPVIATEQVLAVLEFALRGPMQSAPHLIRLVSSAATQLGSVIERKRVEQRLTYLAHYDVLTSLPNRILFKDRLHQVLVDGFRHGRLVGIALINVDRFKTINDSLGHEIGDRFLKAVAERLTSCVRDGDTVARLSGDEFSLILADMAHADDAARIAQKIVSSFNQPFNVDGRDIYRHVSLGMALYPFDESTVDGLVRNADSAMHRAKQAGGGYQFFRPEMTSKAAENLAMENGLRRALDRNELVLLYQPKTDLISGRLTGFEALLRWRQHPTALISPTRFVPVAEEIGLIGPIGEWVLRTACEQAREWQFTNHSPMVVAVNLSPRQFHQDSLIDTVRRVLQETRLDPRCLELEITESLLMQHTRDVVFTLQELSAMGVKVVLDDFGTGYSSLAYLRRFPVDVLKIDQSFVRDIQDDPEDAAIVTTIIAMAHNLGLKAIAEGVETLGQLNYLREKGCDEAQGFLLGMPQPSEDASALIVKNVPLFYPN